MRASLIVICLVAALSHSGTAFAQGAPGVTPPPSPPPMGTGPSQGPVNGPAPGQTEPDSTQQPARVFEITTVVEATERMTTKIAFVVDASGSMANTDRVGFSIGFTRSLLGQEGDELLVAIYAFADLDSRWPGIPYDGNGPPPPDGWTFFPSVTAITDAEEWLRSQGANGSTNPVGAVKRALNEQIDQLTVLIVTDGEFYGPAFVEAIERGQQARVDGGHGRATVVVVGIGPHAISQQHLKTVGELGGGFYIVKEVRSDAEEPPDPQVDGNRK